MGNQKDPLSLPNLKAEHSPTAIKRRLERGPRHSYVRDLVYGAIDGTVTTFAIVAGVTGAGLPAGTILVLGVANLLADGFSMAASNYLGTRADDQLRRRLRKLEEEHIARYPLGEREEIRQLFAAKGFEGENLEHAVKVITSDTHQWVDTMLIEELGLSLTGPNPIKAAWATFAAFVVVGSVPLVTYVFELVGPTHVNVIHSFFWSAMLTGAAFFGVGAMKSRFVGERWWLSGLETLIVGGLAAGIAYSIGAALHGITT